MWKMIEDDLDENRGSFVGICVVGQRNSTHLRNKPKEGNDEGSLGLGKIMTTDNPFKSVLSYALKSNPIWGRLLRRDLG